MLLTTSRTYPRSQSINGLKGTAPNFLFLNLVPTLLPSHPTHHVHGRFFLVHGSAITQCSLNWLSSSPDECTSPYQSEQDTHTVPTARAYNFGYEHMDPASTGILEGLSDHLLLLTHPSHCSPERLSWAQSSGHSAWSEGTNLRHPPLAALF